MKRIFIVYLFIPILAFSQSGVKGWAPRPADTASVVWTIFRAGTGLIEREGSRVATSNGKDSTIQYYDVQWNPVGEHVIGESRKRKPYHKRP